MNLSASVAHLQHTTDEAINLLSRETILGHYHQVVTGVICGSAFEALAWLTVFQVFIGLVCLPLISVLTSSFMSETSAQVSPEKRFMAAPADDYSRLQESPMLFGTAEGHQLSGGPHPNFHSATSAALAPEVFGSGVSPMRGGDQFHRESSPVVSVGSQAWPMGSRNNSGGTLQSFVTDPGLSHSPWPGPMQAASNGASPRAERRVHFADENGGSLFGSQNVFGSQGLNNASGGVQWRA